MSAQENRIEVLQAELESLKQERKESKKANRIQQTWVISKKRLPDAETSRAIVWSDGQMDRCWFQDGKWYSYDGTYFLTEKERIDGVTHWVPIDWMTSREFPKCGPGVVNRLRYLWRRFTDGAQDMAHDYRPKSWGKGNVQLDRKVVYYQDASGKVRLGLPENYSAPKGVEKIICNNVFEAERFSEIQRQQEKSEHRREMEHRERIEGGANEQWRKDAHHLMANARNQVNRDFMQAALKRNESHRPWESDRESFLHSEGYENNH